MKRWLYSLAALPFVGCAAADQVATEIKEAPPELWDQIKGVLLWLVETVWDAVFSWFLNLL